ncbi:ABC transporter ATP-binding protein [Paractinoplanes hotanensis]|uniref:ABC transporter ATP-binding protein n=1 Tax=Paractinoplanes hotanensis TaxID=2906497 RepID=A0ABT0YA96_9ACTN|nr:ABC transporter ATP-binding protein [Actinoplanes hotanensis]MCM4082755.1 ABC transporter ATP-binding protein [Actinoplanes hotanensis]
MSDTLLEVEDLDVRYGDAQALWGVSLTVGAGETVCVVGPNGAGKSTLVNALAGVHRASGGRIRVNGADTTALPGHRVCAHGVAVVPEGRRIFPRMTVTDNLMLGAYRKAARPAHRESVATVHELFPRLAERAGQLAGNLSGGEQQMLAIGGALMARPALLLLDEPSLGLAPVRVDEVYDAVQRIAATGSAWSWSNRTWNARWPSPPAPICSARGGWCPPARPPSCATARRCAAACLACEPVLRRGPRSQRRRGRAGPAGPDRGPARSGLPGLRSVAEG